MGYLEVGKKLVKDFTKESNVSNAHLASLALICLGASGAISAELRLLYNPRLCGSRLGPKA